MNDGNELPARRVRAPRVRSSALVLGAAALVAGLALAGCGSSSSDGGTTTPGSTGGANPAASETATTGMKLTAPADIQKAGVLSICADITFPPMTFMKDNKPTGFDVDVANRLAEAMGVTAEFHQTGFPNIIGALQGGKCNMIINGMSMTAKRAEQVDMVPYLKDAVGFIAKKGNPKQINAIDDLSGKRIAVQVGGVGAIAMENINKDLAAKGKPGATLVNFTQDPSAFEAVISGKVDAFAQDNYVLAYYESKFPGQVAQLGITVQPQTAVIAVRKDEKELYKALTEGIQGLYKAGVMEELVTKWDITKDDLLSADEITQLEQQWGMA